MKYWYIFKNNNLFYMCLLGLFYYTYRLNKNIVYSNFFKIVKLIPLVQKEINKIKKSMDNTFEKSEFKNIYFTR